MLSLVQTNREDQKNTQASPQPVFFLSLSLESKYIGKTRSPVSLKLRLMYARSLPGVRARARPPNYMFNSSFLSIYTYTVVPLVHKREEKKMA